MRLNENRHFDLEAVSCRCGSNCPFVIHRHNVEVIVWMGERVCDHNRWSAKGSTIYRQGQIPMVILVKTDVRSTTIQIHSTDRPEICASSDGILTFVMPDRQGDYLYELVAKLRVAGCALPFIGVSTKTPSTDMAPARRPSRAAGFRM